MDGVVFQDAGFVRSGQDPQWAVFNGRIIEVHAERNDVFESSSGRMRVRDAVL